MPNPYFKFKQFIIWQDECAMKVGTDGVLLGAWAQPGNSQNILDIGTGTGLIALMQAQKSNAYVTAVDIDVKACLQAEKNVKLSPWSDKIEVIHSSLQDFAKKSVQQFDTIISNPPFFENALHAPDVSRTLARHNVELSYEELISCASVLLTPNGCLNVILPYDAEEKIKRIAEQNKLYVSRYALVLPKPNAKPKRILAEFSGASIDYRVEKIVIESAGRHEYSQKYKQLTKDFYLKF